MFNVNKTLVIRVIQRDLIGLHDSLDIDKNDIKLLK
jgi:hypothetical protein